MSAYSDAVLADTPLIYARLGGANSTTVLADSSGNGRNGTSVYNTAQTYSQPSLLVSDTSDLSCLFNSNGALQWADAAWMDVTSLTVEAWVKATSLSSYRLVWDRDGGSSRIFQFRINSNRLEFIFWTNNGGPYFCNGATNLATGTVYHVAATYGSGVAKVYLNGVQDGTASAGTTMAVGTSPMAIAGGHAQGINPVYGLFSGQIDEAAVYGTALSVTRLLAHYNAGTSAGAPPALSVWNGTAEVAATVTVWNGTSEIAASVEIT